MIRAEWLALGWLAGWLSRASSLRALHRSPDASRGPLFLSTPPPTPKRPHFAQNKGEFYRAILITPFFLSQCRSLTLLPPSPSRTPPRPHFPQNKGEFYGAILILPGAAARLADSLVNGTPYVPSLAVEIVYDEGRGGPTIATMLKSILPAVITTSRRVAVVVRRSNGPNVPASGCRWSDARLCPWIPPRGHCGLEKKRGAVKEGRGHRRD